MVLDFLLTLFLVLLNGFFVAAEFAIVKVRSSQIALQTGTTSKRAAEIIVQNLDGFLAATQLGITIASLGLGWVGEDVMSDIIITAMHAIGVTLSDDVAHSIALPLAFITITILHIVFGELAPKSLAIRYPTSTTLSVSIPLRVFYFVCRPFIALLNGFANLILRTVGIKPIQEHEIHTEEELRLIIAESAEGGAIEKNERELIQNVFDFDNRVVRQIMVPRTQISAININTPLEKAVELVFKEGYSRYPVYTKTLDEITSVVHAKDILRNFIEHSGKSLKEIAHEAYFITDGKPIDELLRELQQRKIQMAIVISEYGGTLGIVTLEDILEELVGEIRDEYDQETDVVTEQDEGVYRVIATSSLHDINKFLEKPFLPSDDYETLAGLILHHRSDINEGDQLTIEHYKVSILKTSKSLPDLVELELVAEK